MGLVANRGGRGWGDFICSRRAEKANNTMIERNSNKDRKHTPRDDAYLIGGFAAGIGLVGTAVAHEAWPLLVGFIVGAIAYSAIVIVQIAHEHRIESAEKAGAIEVAKIQAAKAPAGNVIDGSARVIPNIMAPKSEQQQLNFIKLIDNGVATNIPRHWMYMLPDGSEARGDIIEAIIDGAFDKDKDSSIDLRDYIRTRYKVEFSNQSYTKAVKALQQVGAVDKSGKWLIDGEATNGVLRKMRESCLG